MSEFVSGVMQFRDLAIGGLGVKDLDLGHDQIWGFPDRGVPYTWGVEETWYLI